MSMKTLSVVGAVIAIAVCGMPSLGSAQDSRPRAIVEVSRSDSVAIESEIMALVQNALRGILRDKAETVSLRVVFADGKEREGRAAVISRLLDQRLPEKARGGAQASELVIELGEYIKRYDSGLLVVQVRLIGPAMRNGCYAYSASVFPQGKQWRRYLMVASPYDECQSARR